MKQGRKWKSAMYILFFLAAVVFTLFIITSLLGREAVEMKIRSRLDLDLFPDLERKDTHPDVSEPAHFSQKTDWYYLGNFQALGPLVGSIDFAYRREPLLGVSNPYYDRAGTVYFLWLFGKVVVLEETEHWSNKVE